MLMLDNLHMILTPAYQHNSIGFLTHFFNLSKYHQKVSGILISTVAPFNSIYLQYHTIYAPYSIKSIPFTHFHVVISQKGFHHHTLLQPKQNINIAITSSISINITHNTIISSRSPLGINSKLNLSHKSFTSSIDLPTTHIDPTIARFIPHPHRPRAGDPTSTTIIITTSSQRDVFLLVKAC